MGQASSRGSSDDPPRSSRLRPTSWAASTTLSPPEDDSSVSGSEPQLTPASSSRSGSLRFNPFNILSERSDAGSSEAASSNSTQPSRLRRSRMTRARSSLSTSIPNLFHRRPSTRSRDSASITNSTLNFPSASSAALRRTSTPYDRTPFLPRVQVPELDLGIDFDDLPQHTSTEQTPRRRSSWRDGRSSLLSPPQRGIRSMTNQLRRRRSPPRRDEDQTEMLSRLLSVAAAATAASLMGDDHRAVSDARNVAGDGEDGTFDSFLQALQNGRIASALRQTEGENDDNMDQGGENPAPLNFFRMFRFGSGSMRRPEEAAQEYEPTNGQGHGDPDGRMVPIIIVGIRSINPGTGGPQDENVPPFLDAITSFPTPVTTPGNAPIENMLRQPQNGTRFSHRRRASMGGLNTFPSNYDSQRHFRSPERPRPWSTFTDSPSGPLPPPSTPASSGLSAVSSGATTPVLSASPPSPTMPSTASSRRGSFIRRATGAGLEPTEEEPQTQQRTPRQRRLSESDFTRFGSGASRRNGVVEPDHNPGEGSRSWIIYVLGGSYPENHPILTTPSLFSDSPSYEDMLLLSTLLGPVKPPVASEEDVASAPGLYVIRGSAGMRFAEAVDSSDHLEIAADARCLVCLCDYELDDEARRLVKCGHMFHRICIDQWLTTGRNSCPLCRAQGVDEKATNPESTSPDMATPANPQGLAH